MSLTKNDLNQIDLRLKSQKEEILSHVESQKEEILSHVESQKEEILSHVESQKEEIIEEIDGKLTKFRSDFFEKIDPILKEVVTAREERPLIENRLEALEEIHSKGPHSVSR